MKSTDTIEDGVSDGLPVHHMEAFLAHLRAARYAEGKLRKKRFVLTAFVRQMNIQNIALTKNQKNFSRENFTYRIQVI